MYQVWELSEFPFLRYRVNEQSVTNTHTHIHTYTHTHAHTHIHTHTRHHECIGFSFIETKNLSKASPGPDLNRTVRFKMYAKIRQTPCTYELSFIGCLGCSLCSTLLCLLGEVHVTSARSTFRIWGVPKILGNCFAVLCHIFRKFWT